MEVVESLTSVLLDILRNIKYDDGKRTFIREHIKSAVNDKVPEFRLPDGGDWFNVSNPLSESDLKGKVVLLDFFTYCCINCLHLLPHLKAIEDKYSVADGLVIIGVHSAKFENEKKSSNLALALRKLNITHPVINDSDGYMWNSMKISCWPTVVIIAPDGQPLFSLTGEQNKHEIILFAEAALMFYANEISPHPLPIYSNQNVLKSGILNFPAKITRFGNIFAVSDSGNHRILVIDESGCIKFKIGGKSKGFQDGSFEEARFNSPQGSAFYDECKIFVADTENHAIRLIDLERFEVFTVAGTGVQGTCLKGGNLCISQEISSPWDLCFVPSDHVRVSESNSVRIPPPINTEEQSWTDIVTPKPPPSPPPIFLPPCNAAPVVGPSSATKIQGNIPIICEKNENETRVLLIAMCGSHQIWALFLEDTIWWRGIKYGKNVCAAVAGSGKEENRNNTYPLLAAFSQPSGLAYSPSLKCVFIADSESSSIRKLSLEDGSVSHVVGGDRNPTNLFKFGDVDGKGYDAKLQHPLGLTFSEKKNVLYVCDTYNNKLKQIDITTLECTTTIQESNLFNEPSGCVLDEAEEVIYITDTNNHCITTFNLKNKVLENWAVREKEAEYPDVKNDDEWELETEISSNGGLLILLIHLGPEGVSGSWKLDLNSSNIESKEINGKISSEPYELEFPIPPTDSGNTNIAKILFNLSFCKRDVCIIKKCLLTLLITRNNNEKEMKTVQFKKTITQ